MTDRPYIVCTNQWHDYTGGADHLSIEEARACEADAAAIGEEETHTVLVPLDEYVRMMT
jgi:hypothetical protein